MRTIGTRLTVFALVFSFLILFGVVYVNAQTTTTTPIPTPTTDTSLQQRDVLNKRILELEGKVSDLHKQSNSLNSQIQVMDNQIKLTEYRVNATQAQITDLSMDIDSATKRMNNLEGSLNDVTKVLINRIVATYQTGGVQPIQVLLSSDDVNDFFTRSNYLKIVQEHDKRLIYDTQQARNDYANQKIIFENKKKKIEALKLQLEDYTKQLDGEKVKKQELLAVTNNDEKKYQELLAEARKQIASFKSFALSHGGSSILPAQASPDGWYFNQRDERWGNNNIGNSSDKMWEVGCLVTSTAMLRKHKGESITPADVARESSYFFSNTAMMNIPWNGGKFTSKWSKDLGTIDSKLASGPIIVGLYAGPYGTHFIVLKSGSNGDYIMNDPWNGADLKFKDYYNTGQIFQYGYLN